MFVVLSVVLIFLQRDRFLALALVWLLMLRLFHLKDPGLRFCDIGKGFCPKSLQI